MRSAKTDGGFVGLGVVVGGGTRTKYTHGGLFKFQQVTSFGKLSKFGDPPESSRLTISPYGKIVLTGDFPNFSFEPVKILDNDRF
jgi:hypothetical protein